VVRLFRGVFICACLPWWRILVLPESFCSALISSLMR
jgi:hypothetical protein